MAKSATAETPAPTVTVEDAGPCSKRLQIEASPETVSHEFDEALATLGGEVQLPGFRKGMAPRKLIERRFGKASRDEARQRIIEEAYKKAIKEHDLHVVGEPELGEDSRETEVELGKAFSFTIDVEVAPDVTMPSLEDVKVIRPTIDITPEMVEKEMDRLCADHGSLEDLEVAGAGDYCTGRGALTVDGEDDPVLDIPGAVIRIPLEDANGAGMILGVKVDDFVKQAGSPKVGETITVKTTGPENHETESVRGAPITISFAIEKVYRVKPAAPDETAQTLGLGDSDQLRAIITQRLEQRTLVEQQSIMRSQLADALLERIDFALPARLSSNQAARNLERSRLEMLRQGATEEQIEEGLAEIRAASDEDATRELKLFFILDAAAKELDVDVTEQEIAGYIAQIAASRGMRPVDVQNQLAQSGRIYGVAQQIREHKTLDTLLGKTQIEDMDAADFDKTLQKEKMKKKDEASDAAKPAKKKTSKKASTTTASTASKKKTSSKKTSSKKTK